MSIERYVWNPIGMVRNDAMGDWVKYQEPIVVKQDIATRYTWSRAEIEAIVRAANDELIQRLRAAGKL